jgi:hypothetical protein
MLLAYLDRSILAGIFFGKHTKQLSSIKPRQVPLPFLAYSSISYLPLNTDVSKVRYDPNYGGLRPSSHSFQSTRSGRRGSIACGDEKAFLDSPLLIVPSHVRGQA